MADYKQKLDDLFATVNRTGERQNTVFEKSKFLAEYPEAASDPRMALTPRSFVLGVSRMESITVGELRKMCEASGEGNMLAARKILATSAFPDHRKISLLHEDIEAIRATARRSQAAVNRQEKPKAEPTTRPAAKPVAKPDTKPDVKDGPLRRKMRE